jgi:alkylation response protein AidB-like acyl-CoA dehydrogenase
VQLHLDRHRQAFADNVRSWLAAHVPPTPLPSVNTAEGQASHRQWERTLFAAGFSGLGWPVEFGGAGLDPVMEAVFNEEYVRAGAPERLNRLGLGLAGPAIIAFGDDEQKSRWLRRILTCEDVWCQGFSETEPGSDLAAVRTGAERDRDCFVVNGQKTWTSVAAWADWMFALVRTRPGSTGRTGLTYLMIPMDLAGIEVRPLQQVSGSAGFAEVFFTDVRVPAQNVLGEEGDGWRIAMATLGFERGGGVAQPARFDRDFANLVDLVHLAGLATDQIIRDQVASRYVETQVFRRFFQHTVTRLEAGKPVGPVASLSKLYWSQMEVRTFETALDVLGDRAEVLDEPTDTPLARILPRKYWYSRASEIYAGTTEVQKNIIAERLLGLPKEPRWN